FEGLAGCREALGGRGEDLRGQQGRLAGYLGGSRNGRAERTSMNFQEIAGAACRALTARKDGPSLYDVCDPLLLKYDGGDRHLGKFYRTALANPALRPL